METRSQLKRATATVDCPKSMVGRVIGKSGETIKALQTYTGALIQIDQTVEPTKVTISGTPHSLSLAVSMVTDIVKGTFKGFALLRQITNPGGFRPGPLGPMAQPRPVYAPGYGLIPPSQLYGADERTAGVVPVGFGGRAQPGAVGWPPGQVTPSQMILSMPPTGVMRPMGQQPGLMGADDAMMPLPGYAAGGMPMAYGYPPDAYAMPGMMPAPDVMYGDGMMGGPAGGIGSQARLYQAAGGKGAGAAGGRGGAGDKGGAEDVMPGAGQYVQVMDPEGKVYYLPQGQQ